VEVKYHKSKFQCNERKETFSSNDEWSPLWQERPCRNCFVLFCRKKRPVKIVYNGLF